MENDPCGECRVTCIATDTHWEETDSHLVTTNICLEIVNSCFQQTRLGLAHYAGVPSGTNGSCDEAAPYALDTSYLGTLSLSSTTRLTSSYQQLSTHLWSVCPSGNYLRSRGLDFACLVLFSFGNMQKEHGGNASSRPRRKKYAAQRSAR